MTNELLQRAEQRIKGSVERVAKKQFKEDPKVATSIVINSLGGVVSLHNYTPLQ